jgi:AmmeMemoRadiSam system protein A
MNTPDQFPLKEESDLDSEGPNHTTAARTVKGKVSNSSLNRDEKARLLSVARSSLENAIIGTSMIDIGDLEGVLAEHRGAFVTLRKNGALRGCIGVIAPRRSLAETVSRCAVLAAIDDPRFEPLSAEELGSVSLELSVLSLARQVSGAAEIRAGIDGVIVSRGRSRALLLPQTATENDWTAEDLISAACRKAGLAADSWRRGNVSIEAFTAEIFSE